MNNFSQLVTALKRIPYHRWIRREVGSISISISAVSRPGNWRSNSAAEFIPPASRQPRSVHDEGVLISVKNGGTLLEYEDKIRRFGAASKMGVIKFPIDSLVRVVYSET